MSYGPIRPDRVDYAGIVQTLWPDQPAARAQVLAENCREIVEGQTVPGMTRRDEMGIFGCAGSSLYALKEPSGV